MKQLAANLKTLYQCKNTWFYHVLYLGILLTIGTSKGLANFDFYSIAGFAFIHFIYGCVIGCLIHELFRKPFLYCLPGQKKPAQLMTLLIWLSMILIFSLISGSINEDVKTDHDFYLVSIGLLSLNYWLGVALMSRRGVAFIIIPIISSLILFPILYTMKSFDSAPMLLAAPVIIVLIHIILRYFLKRYKWRVENRRLNIILYYLGLGISAFIISSLILLSILYAMKSFALVPQSLAAPGILFLICIILSYWLYRSIGRIEKRHLCSLTIFLREGIRFGRKGKTHRVIKGLSDFFSGRITASQNSSFLSHIWAQVYLIFGSFITNLSGWLFGIILGVCVLLGCVYYLEFILLKHSPINVNYAFTLPIILLCNLFYLNYQRFNSFLLTGRRACFFRGISNLFTSILISLIMMTSFFIIFFIISGGLPHNKWILLISPIIVIPVIGALTILLGKNNWRLHISRLVAVFAMAFGINYLWTVDLKDTLIYFNTTDILLAAIAVGFHLFVLHYDSMKRPLC